MMYPLKSERYLINTYKTLTKVSLTCVCVCVGLQVERITVSTDLVHYLSFLDTQSLFSSPHKERRLQNLDCIFKLNSSSSTELGGLYTGCTDLILTSANGLILTQRHGLDTSDNRADL